MAPIAAARQVLKIQRKRPPARGSGVVLLVDMLEKAAAAAGVGIGGEQARIVVERKRALGCLRGLPTTL